jgi:hypothetical protein
MSIIEFYRDFTQIQKTIVLTNKQIKDEGSFPYSIREKFNESLKDLLNLLKQDNFYENFSKKSWHVAHRIVQFSTLQSKIGNIQKRILTLNCPPYFTKKIEQTILPPLEKRIKEMSRSIGAIERLPFNENQARNEFLQRVKNELDLQDQRKTIEVEKEFFHLLAHSLDKKKLKQINTKTYEGNWPIYSLMSWSQVLYEFIKEGDSRESVIGQSLLNMLSTALPIVIKHSYAHRLPQIRIQDPAAEIAYYKDLIELSKSREKIYQSSTVFQDEFFQKYSLGQQPSSIPTNVLITEIARDIKLLIEEMSEGKSLIFPLGTHDHTVAVQVTCLRLPSPLYPKGNYRYKIFNTGEGIAVFHCMEKKNGEQKVRPLIFRDVSQMAFSYSFIYELVRLSLQQSTVKEFYQLHDQVLVHQAGGKKDRDNGGWHSIQKYGTCSYSAIEAWIDSYLTEKQIKHLELIKAKMSTHKQKKVVQILKQVVKAAAKWKIVQKGKYKVHFIFEEKNKKLNESLVLLRLGQEYLQQVTIDYARLKNP